MTQQLARPMADIGSSGTWGFTPSPPTTFYSHLNEVEPDDNASFVSSPSGGGWFEVRLDQLVAPEDLTNGPQTLTVRIKGSTSGARVGIDLLQGGTLIATKRTTVGTTYESVTLALTPEEKSKITDFGDLRVRIYDDFVIVPGCGYPYRKTIYATWLFGAGDCTCFTGTFPLNWNGTNWEGVFSGCGGGDVTVLAELVTPPPPSPPTPLMWRSLTSGVGYTFSYPETLGGYCGELPSTTYTFISGACTGSTSLVFSENP